MRLHKLAEVAVLTPASLTQKAGQALGRADDGAQAVADGAGIGGLVDVGSDHERIAPDRVGGVGDEAMPCGDNQVVEPLDGVGGELSDVAAEASPVERLVVAPTVDAHDSSQGTMLLGEVLQPIVVEVAAEADRPQDKDRPGGHSRAALVGTGDPIDVLGDGIEQFVAEFGPAVDVLQGSEDGDDLIAAVGVEPDIWDDGAIQPELGVEGPAHRSAPGRFPGLSCGNGGFIGETLQGAYDLRGASLLKTRVKRDSNTFSDGLYLGVRGPTTPTHSLALPDRFGNPASAAA